MNKEIRKRKQKLNSLDFFVENIPEPSWLEKADVFVNLLLTHLKVDNWEFSITFCDDDYIRQLNRDYRDKDSATDVLTFAQDDEPLPFADQEELHNAGDIIISLHTLGENAEYFGVDQEEELKRLIIHGVLHLQGRDHSDNSPEQEMLVFQEKILEEMAGVKIF
jgi:probable rRNA maturation factor